MNFEGNAKSLDSCGIVDMGKIFRFGGRSSVMLLQRMRRYKSSDTRSSVSFCRAVACVVSSWR